MECDIPNYSAATRGSTSFVEVTKLLGNFLLRALEFFAARESGAGHKAQGTALEAPERSQASKDRRI